MFIVSASPAEDPAQVATRVDLALDVNNLILGEPIVMQAISQGADTFVHYSFPRHMGVPQLAWRRDVMRDTAIREGIRFVELNAPDPLGDGGQPATEMHIMQDIPRAVAEFGVNTAFFGTNCAMQTPIITQVLATGAIYPQPCCPSPYHGFPAALGIKSNLEDPNNLQYVIGETRKIVKEKGVEGRLSTWPVPVAMMFTAGATEYIIKILDGETNLRFLDKEVLDQCPSNYAKVKVETEPYVESGKEISNVLFALVGFLDY
jgi:hypothetical protein